MDDIPHYMHSRGKLTATEVSAVIGNVKMIHSCQKAVYAYFVDGKTVKQLGVNSALIIPLLKKVHFNHATTVFNDYKHRFLYTNDFNPSAR